MTETTTRRLIFALGLMAVGLPALVAAVSPRLGYAVAAAPQAAVVPVTPPLPLAGIDGWLALLACALLPVVAYDAWRAAELFATDPAREDGPGPPWPVAVLLAAAALAPAWSHVLAVPFGLAGRVAGLVGFEVGMLSAVTFVVASSQAAAERAGETPRVLLLGALYHLSGAPGVWYARRLFPRSKVLAEVTEKLPAGFLVLVVLAVAAAVLWPTADAVAPVTSTPSTSGL